MSDMQGKDYYSTLGVDGEASQQEIKRAYRELAKKFHPDANPGDLGAEKKFKDISEAYDVLKDPEKRKKYDQLSRFGFSSQHDDWFSFDPHAFRRQGGAWPFESQRFESGTHFSFSGILKELFGIDNIEKSYSSFHKKPASQKIPTAEMTISFDESINGTTKFLKLSTNAQCYFCYGSGYTHGRTCHECQGMGKTKEFTKIKVKIPAGIEDGHKLRLSGIPLNHRHNGSTSEVVVKIKVKEHKFFVRKGADIYCEVPLSDELLKRGAKIRVSTIAGKKIDVQIPPGTAKGTFIRLANMGISQNGAKGDQFIKVI